MQRGQALIFLLIGIVILVASGAYYLGRQPTPNQSAVVTSPPSSSTTSDETAIWQTYKNYTYKYEIKYPGDYRILPQTDKEKSQLGVDANTCITLKSTQQCIVLINYWPNSLEELLKLKAPTDFSKAKPQDFSSINVKGKKYVYEIGHSATQVEMLIPRLDSDIGVFTISYINYPGEPETVKILEQVVSTFKFTDQDSLSNPQFSSEGESCGRNAGAAGDAKCAPGLTCVYKTSQEKLDGIGTCVK